MSQRVAAWQRKMQAPAGRVLRASLPLALAVVAAAGGFPAAAGAQEDEAPGLGLLEYLGSWQKGDEAWLVLADIGGGAIDNQAAVPGDDGQRKDESNEAESSGDDAAHGDARDREVDDGDAD